MSSSPARTAAGRPSAAQRRIFLDALADSSNVAASARAAGIKANAAYRLRRSDAGFAARWQAALCEGYARLEEELLAEALIAASGNVKDSTLKSRAQKYRLGLALLAAHRAAVRGVKAADGAQPPVRVGDARAELTARLDAMAARLADDDSAPGVAADDMGAPSGAADAADAPPVPDAD